MNQQTKHKCPYVPEHTVEIDDEGHPICIDHMSGDPGAPKYKFRIEELERQKTIQEDLIYREKVQEVKEGMSITDEELRHYFSLFENKYLRIDILKKVLGPTPSNPNSLIKLNWPQKKNKNGKIIKPTAVVPSSFMTRLSSYTRERWKQKRHRGEDGTDLIRFWTDGPYDPEEEKYKRKIRKEERQRKLFVEKSVLRDKKLHQENLKLYEEIKKKETESKKK